MEGGIQKEEDWKRGSGNEENGLNAKDLPTKRRLLSGAKEEVAEKENKFEGKIGTCWKTEAPCRWQTKKNLTKAVLSEEGYD